VEVTTEPSATGQPLASPLCEIVLSADPRGWVGSDLPAAGTPDRWRMKISIHRATRTRRKQAEPS
jgi:hypothetical protein